MIAWGCDRCGTASNTPGTKNKRPDGWETVRTVPRESIKGVSYLLCPDCGRLFYDFLGMVETQ